MGYQAGLHKLPELCGAQATYTQKVRPLKLLLPPVGRQLRSLALCCRVVSRLQVHTYGQLGQTCV